MLRRTYYLYLTRNNNVKKYLEKLYEKLVTIQNIFQSVILSIHSALRIYHNFTLRKVSVIMKCWLVSVVGRLRTLYYHLNYGLVWIYIFHWMYYIPSITKYQYCYKIEDNGVLSFYICLTTTWTNIISCQLSIMFIRFDLRCSFYSFYYIFIRPFVWYHWLWSIVLWSSLLVQLISLIVPIFMCIYLDIKESAFPFIRMWPM